VLNSNGLITGSSYNIEQNTFMLCGYTQSLAPFIVNISNFDESDIFSGTINKIDLTDSIGASQTEGICYFSNDKLFLSREEFIYQSIELEPKLYSFIYYENSSSIEQIKDTKIELYPNPANSYITINKLYDEGDITVTNILGKPVKCTVNTQLNRMLIDVSKLQNGIYFVILKFEKEIQINRFIKI